MRKSLVILISMFFLIIIGCDDDFKSEEIDQALARVEELGFNTGLAFSKTQGYNPLNKKFGVYNKIDEISLVGLEYREHSLDKSRRLALDIYGDSLSSNVVATRSFNESWTKLPLKNAPGDVDGDGFEEIVYVVFNLAKLNEFVLKIGDDLSSRYGLRSYVVKVDRPLTLGRVNDREDYIYKIDVSCGDIDGDGRDEIAIVIGHSLIILDDKEAGFSVLHQDFWIPDNLEDFTIMNVHCADIDEDGMAEILYTTGVNLKPIEARLHILKYSGGSFANIFTSRINHSLNLEYANLTTGDIDGDRRLEIILAGDAENRDDLRVGILDDYLSDFAVMYLSTGDDLSLPRSRDKHKSVVVETFRPEGLPEIDQEIATPVPMESILVYRYVLQYNVGTGLIDKKFTIRDYTRDLAATGDVTGDGKDDIVLQTNDDLFIYGYDEDELDFVEIKRFDCDFNSDYYPSICLANIDNDSEILMYLDQREIIYSQPEILAVLASPPYYSKYTQNLVAFETCFGQANSVDTSESHTVGIAAGVAFGGSAETPILGSLAGSFKMGYYLNLSFDYQTSTMTSYSASKSFISGAGEDVVVMMCQPFEAYYYEIVSSPHPESVGKIISINLPKPTQTLSFERNSFNENMKKVGLLDYLVDEKIIAHKIGDASSYPSLADKNSLESTKENFICSEDVITPGTTETMKQNKAISKTVGSSSSGSFGLEAGVELEVAAGGMYFGFNLGVRYGYTMTVSVSDTTTFATTIPDIPDLLYPGNFYGVGLMGYTEQLGDSEFYVVNYWVQ
ncbi:MAG: VCBS repeat-containing protein [Spirochaetales bacterium]|nr:VCBS repeat-containing protein [Spirochaetales bacterium]